MLSVYVFLCVAVPPIPGSGKSSSYGEGSASQDLPDEALGYQ